MAQPAAPGPVPMVNSSAVVDDPAGLRAALDQDGYLFLPGLVPRSAVLAGMRRFADVIGEAVRPGAREGDLLVNPAAEPGKDNGIIRPEKADALMADPTIRAVSTTDYYPPTYTHTHMQHTHNKKRATGQAQQRECEMAMVHREMSGRLVQVIGSEEIVGLFERLFGGQSAAFDHKWFRFVLPGRAASWLSHTRGRTGVHQGQADRVSRQDQKKQAAQQAEGQGSTSRQHTQVGGETVRGRHQPHIRCRSQEFIAQLPQAHTDHAVCSRVRSGSPLLRCRGHGLPHGFCLFRALRAGRGSRCATAYTRNMTQRLERDSLASICDSSSIPSRLLP